MNCQLHSFAVLVLLVDLIYDFLDPYDMLLMQTKSVVLDRQIYNPISQILAHFLQDTLQVELLVPMHGLFYLQGVVNFCQCDSFFSIVVLCIKQLSIFIVYNQRVMVRAQCIDYRQT